MPPFDRPQLRRRSQSEQVVPTKATLAMTSLHNRVKDASNEQAKYGSRTGTPVQSNISSFGVSDTQRIKTPLTPSQNTMASIIENQGSTLPPKPDAAVLAAAAAKRQKKQVLFSTPTSSMLHSPIMPHDRLSNHQVGNGSLDLKGVSTESHLPPPPYTPAGLPTHLPYSINQSRGYDYPCTPACNTIRHAPAPAPPHFAGPPHPHVSSVTTIFPSVIAASEALRINLGLGNDHLDAVHAPYQSAGSHLNLSLQRSPSVPGLPLPPVQFPGGYHGAPKTAAGMQAVQQKLISSLDPHPGQVQPLGSMSPNLPPVVNTGHKGPMKVQPGDWSCLVCSFINWRRRKYCMRCCPFAEGNANLSSSMLASMAASQNPVYAAMSAPARPIYSMFATPPRHITPRAPAMLGPVQMTGTFVPSAVAYSSAAHVNLSTGPMPISGPLQSPFGAICTNAGHPMPREINALPVQGQQMTVQNQSGLGTSTFLYDSGYARFGTTEQSIISSPQQAKITEIDRPLTPSPTGTHSSPGSFTFSNSPPSDADSPTTSVNSNGSTSSVSSPDSVSKALRTPPSSKFRSFHNADKTTGLPVSVQDSTTNIEHRLENLRL